MNGGNCETCSQSPWVQRANQFIGDLGSPRGEVETVRFLLQNGHCGIDHRTGIDRIREHLDSIGLNYGRSAFQNNVLTHLKRRGIVATLVYSGSPGGVFIPCNQDEIRRACRQVFRRVIQVLSNLEGSATSTPFSKIVAAARQQMQSLEQEI